MNGIFWPSRPQHVIRTVRLPFPGLSPSLIEPIRKILFRVDALRSIQGCSDPDSHVIDELKKVIAIQLAEILTHLQDGDSRAAIGYIAAGLLDSRRSASASQAMAALDVRVG